jgi:hypothetical protein
LSKKALEKFVNFTKTVKMFDVDGQLEDVAVGESLANKAIFVDTRDDVQQQRFFPTSIVELVKVQPKKLELFYYNYTYYNVTYENLDCCSKIPAAFHYMGPSEKTFLEYSIYRSQVYGLPCAAPVELPRKLSIDEIIRESDKKVYTPNFRNHVDHHNFSSSEMEEMKKKG